MRITDDQGQNTVAVLDIDLDLFVDPRTTHCSRRRDGRVIDCQSWAPDRVARYLASKLGLDRKPPGGAHFFETHDEALGVLCEMESAVHLVHLDAHADLGIGQDCYRFHSEFLALEQEARRQHLHEFAPREGDFVLYAVACGFVTRFDYVTHPDVYRTQPDIPIGMDEWDNEYDNGRLHLRRFQGSYRDYGFRGDAWSSDLSVPIRMHCRDSFKTRGRFDCVFVTRSPYYTPESSDRVYALLQDMLAQ